MEACGGWIKPPPCEDRPRLSACDTGRVEYRAVRSARRVVDDLEPGWVEEVRRACFISNDPREIAGLCELDLTAVVAILENMKARGGELPTE